MDRPSGRSRPDRLAARSRAQLARYGAAAAPHVGLVVERGRTSLRSRLARLRAKSWQVGQCAVAAGVAWFVAYDVFGHPRPFFAPIVALISLGTSYGQRLRRVAEVTVGVAVGVFLGDLYTQLLGRGPWQIIVMVAVAMVIALLLDASPLLVNQVAIQSLVVVTILPGPGAAFLRWTDAVIGGGVALVAASVVPRAPLRRPRQQAGAVVSKIAELLRSAADSIEDGDAPRALEDLRDARSTDTLVAELRAAADEGLSIVASSPFRRRHLAPVRHMAELAEPLDFALRNTRVLVRRVAVACYRAEPVPLSYAGLVRQLADAADAMAAELTARRMPSGVRDKLLAVGEATTAAERSSGLSAEVILAQVRSLTADLLAVSGLDPLEATDRIPPLGSAEGS